MDQHELPCCQELTRMLLLVLLIQQFIPTPHFPPPFPFQRKPKDASPLGSSVFHQVHSSNQPLKKQEIATSPANTSPHRAQARRIYTRLRRNLVSTIYDAWRETGFAWEQYNPETGAGQRTQHFTGWTSLVVVIMGMEELEGEGDGAAAGGRMGHGEL